MIVLIGIMIPLTMSGPTVGIKDVSIDRECESGYAKFHEVLSPLGDLISKGEGDWNAINRGWAGDTPGGIDGLTGKTFDQYNVGEVIQLQRSRRVFAVGRYQFIPVTLRFAVAHSSVNENDMFTPETQDRLFSTLLQYKRPAIGAYIRGDHDNINWALNEMAKEWSSVEYRWGRSYYSYGGNRAHISRSEMRDALNDLRADFLNS